MPQLILVFRIVIIPVLLYNIWYSRGAIRNIFSGHATPLCYHKAVLFFTCVPILGYQIISIFDLEYIEQGPYSLGVLLAFLFMNVIAILAHFSKGFQIFENIVTCFGEDNIQSTSKFHHLRTLYPNRVDAALEELHNKILKEELNRD